MAGKAGKIWLGIVGALLAPAMAGVTLAGDFETGIAVQEKFKIAAKDADLALLNAYKTITETIDAYIDGGRQGSSEIMKQAFHPGANVYGFVDGQLVGGPVQKLYDLVGSRPPAGDIPYKIVHLEAMEDVAMVRVDIDNWSGAKYCGMFALVKVDGQWKITSKVSHKF